MFEKMKTLSLLFCNTFSFSLSSVRASETINKRYLDLGIYSLPKYNYSCYPSQTKFPTTLAHNKSLLQQRTHKSTSSKFSRGKGSSKEDQDDDDYENDGMDSTVSL
jgi:hypothetical protein